MKSEQIGLQKNIVRLHDKLPGLFVAAITYTCFRFSNPSNSVSKVLTTRAEASDYIIIQRFILNIS